MRLYRSQFQALDNCIKQTSMCQSVATSVSFIQVHCIDKFYGKVIDYV